MVTSPAFTLSGWNAQPLYSARRKVAAEIGMRRHRGSSHGFMQRHHAKTSTRNAAAGNAGLLHTV